MGGRGHWAHVSTQLSRLGGGGGGKGGALLKGFDSTVVLISMMYERHINIFAGTLYVLVYTTMCPCNVNIVLPPMGIVIHVPKQRLLFI